MQRPPRPQVAPITAPHIFKLCQLGAYTGTAACQAWCMSSQAAGRHNELQR
jgi:hypothetical protein